MELLLQAHVPYLSFCRVLEVLHSCQDVNKVSLKLFHKKYLQCNACN